jgi:DNA-directed RNA polymerase specialized sigma24 family protein
MSEMILSISAEADVTPSKPVEKIAGRRQRMESGPLADSLPAHQFPACRDRGEASRDEQNPPAELEGTIASEPINDFFAEEDRRQRIYRSRTVGMLRRYMRYSIETGRLPSLVGREFFRSNVTKYQVTTFEDRVIFVHDMERCLHRLDEFSQQVLARIVLQEYGHEDAARLLGCARMTVHRALMEALDELSGILVDVGLLDVVPSNRQISCQGGKSGCFSLSDCEDNE